MSKSSSTLAEALECEANGPTMDELLANAAEVFFSQVVDPETMKERDERTFEIPWEGTNNVMLQDFLKECLTLLRTEKFIAKSAEVEIDSDEVAVTLRGEVLNPARHSLITDIRNICDDVQVDEDMHGTFHANFTLEV